MHGELKIIRDIILSYHKNHHESKQKRPGWYKHTNVWEVDGIREFRKLCKEIGVDIKFSLTNRKLIISIILKV